MSVYMSTRFQILRKTSDGTFVPVNGNEVKIVAVGPFRFVINGKEVPVAWDSYSVSEPEPGIFEFASGMRGYHDKDTLSDAYADELRAMGLSSDNLTAAFLLSASQIAECYVCIDDEQQEDICFGGIEDNASKSAVYRVKLHSISVGDDTAPTCLIGDNILDDYNSGNTSKALDGYATGKICLFCSCSMSGDAPDGSQVLVCFDCAGHEGKEMIVEEDETCENFN